MPALDRMLDYTVPPGWEVASGQASLFDRGDPSGSPRGASGGSGAARSGPLLRVGTIVRVPLRGRRERGWVVELDRVAPAGVRLLPIAKVTGEGPPPDLIELSAWAAHRWAGPRTTFLRAASPERAVSRVVQQRRAAGSGAPAAAPGGIDPEVVTAALSGGVQVLRLPPTVDPFGLVAAAGARGQALVLAPSPAAARRLARRLSYAGLGAVHHPDGWAAAAGGATVVGSRAAAWAPTPELAAVVILDEHDERYRDQRSPTWHAREVVIERARRAGVPCVLVSPAPSLEALALAGSEGPLRLSRNSERAAWPVPQLVDRRDEEPGRAGAVSPALARFLRGDGVAVAVLNRTGRAKLLACASCGELATCEACETALGLPASAAVGEGAPLVCPRCGFQRPPVCAACGAQRLKLLRPGVSRIREELEMLLGEPVVEVTAATATPLPPARVYIGTEAVLYRLPAADTVAFLDLDGDLGAARFRASERVMANLVRAARLLAGRRDGAKLVIQTRQPDHPVFAAVRHADPGRLAEVELARRRVFGYPPFGALAQLSGAAAESFAAAVRAATPDVGVLGPRNGAWLVTAADPTILADALAAVERPAKVRVAVDPADV